MGIRSQFIEGPLSSLRERLFPAVRGKVIPADLGKVRLSKNERLKAGEFAVACALCDIAAEVLRVGQARAPGGIFWGEVDKSGPHSLHLRKSREEIDVSILLRNCFRDFPTIIYEFDDITPVPDFWVRRYIRLCEGVPRQWHVQIPARFGEIGWNVGGFPVNRHTAFLQERVNVQLHLGMEHALAAQHCARVLEIGGGSGEMGYVICRNRSNATWYDCDLMQSLIYNAIHMAVWFPRKRHYIYIGNLPITVLDERLVLRSAAEAAQVENAVVNIPHFLLKDFTGKLSLNLALNAWSFSEMPAAEVERYGRFIHDHLAPGGLLIEQNGLQAEHGGCNAKETLERIFPERHSFEVPLLPRGGIAGGPIDAWALAPPAVADSVSLKCFDDKGDNDDLRYSPDDFGLLSKVAGLEAF
jgi:hypothetical protein